jgi:hypothetical protein
MGPSPQRNEPPEGVASNVSYGQKRYIERTDALGRHVCFNNGDRVPCQKLEDKPRNPGKTGGDDKKSDTLKKLKEYPEADLRNAYQRITGESNVDIDTIMNFLADQYVGQEQGGLISREATPEERAALSQESGIPPEQEYPAFVIGIPGGMGASPLTGRKSLFDTIERKSFDKDEVVEWNSEMELSKTKEELLSALREGRIQNRRTPVSNSQERPTKERISKVNINHPQPITEQYKTPKPKTGQHRTPTSSGTIPQNEVVEWNGAMEPADSPYHNQPTDKKSMPCRHPVLLPSPFGRRKDLMDAAEDRPVMDTKSLNRTARRIDRAVRREQNLVHGIPSSGSNYALARLYRQQDAVIRAVGRHWDNRLVSPSPESKLPKAVESLPQKKQDLETLQGIRNDAASDGESAKTVRQIDRDIKKTRGGISGVEAAAGHRQALQRYSVPNRPFVSTQEKSLNRTVQRLERAATAAQRQDPSSPQFMQARNAASAADDVRRVHRNNRLISPGPKANLPKANPRKLLKESRALQNIHEDAVQDNAPEPVRKQIRKEALRKETEASAIRNARDRRTHLRATKHPTLSFGYDQRPATPVQKQRQARIQELKGQQDKKSMEGTYGEKSANKRARKAREENLRTTTEHFQRRRNDGEMEASPSGPITVRGDSEGTYDPLAKVRRQQDRDYDNDADWLQNSDRDEDMGANAVFQRNNRSVHRHQLGLPRNPSTSHQEIRESVAKTQAKRSKPDKQGKLGRTASEAPPQQNRTKLKESFDQVHRQALDDSDRIRSTGTASVPTTPSKRSQKPRVKNPAFVERKTKLNREAVQNRAFKQVNKEYQRQKGRETRGEKSMTIRPFGKALSWIGNMGALVKPPKQCGCGGSCGPCSGKVVLKGKSVGEKALTPEQRRQRALNRVRQRWSEVGENHHPDINPNNKGKDPQMLQNMRTRDLHAALGANDDAVGEDLSDDEIEGAAHEGLDVSERRNRQRFSNYGERR